jgi:Cu/Ag efflux protein CusF
MIKTLEATAAAVLVFGMTIAANAGEAPMVNGEVTKIDESAGKITIKHDAIPNLEMGAMTMVFKAGEGVAVKDVKPGEKIKFQAEKVNGQLTVMKVEKAK